LCQPVDGGLIIYDVDLPDAAAISASLVSFGGHFIGGMLDNVHPGVVKIDMSKCYTNIDDIVRFTNLTTFVAPRYIDENDLDLIAELPNLTSLSLRRCMRVLDIPVIPNLKSLDLSGCRYIHDISPLAKMPNLTSLNLAECFIDDLNVLVQLTSLTRLGLSKKLIGDACNIMQDGLEIYPSTSHN
jgi:hypothetical protein